VGLQNTTKLVSQDSWSPETASNMGAFQMTQYSILNSQ